MAARMQKAICAIVCFLVVAAVTAIIVWTIKSGHSRPGPIKPVYSVVNAAMTNTVYRDDHLTADFSFTLKAVNSNKNKTVDFTNSTEATSLYFEREAELPTLVASSSALPVPSPLPPRSSDNLFTFGLRAQDAPLDAGNSEFFKTGKSGYSTFDHKIFARLEVKFMARLDEKSTYGLLRVKCRRLKYSSQGFEVNDSWCISYVKDQ